MHELNVDVLGDLRNELRKYIEQNFETVEEFCWANELNKATISNFLRDKKDFRVSTLLQIAAAMKRKLVIKTR